MSKIHKIPSPKRLRGCVYWGYWSNSKHLTERCLYQFLGSNKWLVRKPFPNPQNEHGIAWVNKSYAIAIDLNLGYYIIKIGLRCTQNLCHQPSFLGPDLPQELTMETTDSPDKQSLELMESQEDVWVFPRDLLYISWGSLENQIDCSWTSLDSLDGFLSNVAMLTLKSMQKNSTSCALN